MFKYPFSLITSPFLLITSPFSLITSHLSLIISLLLLTACSGGRYERMQQELTALQAMNQTDSILTNDSLAQALADYFDRHGTPNEQMEAHYLLGCTHADRGEAPAALAAYHNAIDRAERIMVGERIPGITTDTGCNYAQLWRVYAQMGGVYYLQNLVDDQLRCIDKAVSYALMACDTMAALNEYAQKMMAFCRKSEHDSVLAVFSFVHGRLMTIGREDLAACYCGGVFESLIEKECYDSAMHYMDEYEKHSGYFDSNGDIFKGMEVYYYFKGRCYLERQQYDSAHHYFMKELREGEDFNNQNAAAMGLSMLFKATGQPDSAVKYALYSYDMNDSVYSQMATSEVEKTKGLYDYSRHQQMAEREKARADRERLLAWEYMSYCIALIAILAFFANIVYHKLQKDRADYDKAIDKLERLQSEYMHIREQEELYRQYISERDRMAMEQIEMKKLNEVLKRQMEEKEAELKEARTHLDKDIKRRNRSHKKANDRLKMSPAYRELLGCVEENREMTEITWHKVHKMVIDIFPDFYYFVSAKENSLNKNEYRCCILLRLDIGAFHISQLLSVSPSYVTKMAGNISKVLFDRQGVATKELTGLLSHFF